MTSGAGTTGSRRSAGGSPRPKWSGSSARAPRPARPGASEKRAPPGAVRATLPHEIPPTDPVPKIQRAYRALLRMLPFEFRAEYGGDMEEAFAEEREDVRARHSRAETLGFWFRTAGDFARTAPRQHWDVLKQDVR